jgi:hypothetical protein
MNDEVRKALFCLERNDISWHTVNNELTRLTEIADSVDPLVIRLHDVTAKLEAANALLRDMRDGAFNIGGWADAIDEYFDAHLSENGHG